MSPAQSTEIRAEMATIQSAIEDLKTAVREVREKQNAPTEIGPDKKFTFSAAIIWSAITSIAIGVFVVAVGWTDIRGLKDTVSEHSQILVQIGAKTDRVSTELETFLRMNGYPVEKPAAAQPPSKPAS